MVKLCIYCKHCRPATERYSSFRCHHPSLVKTTSTTLVDGSIDPFPCVTCREFESLCGKEGNFFEEKTGPIDKLITWFRT